VSKPDSIVFLVDDDPSFRRSSERLLRAAGYQVQSFPSAREFLNRGRPSVAACLVTDMRMPGLSGLDLQQELSRASWQIPIIFITGHADVPTTVRAMKSGAVNFLTKPFQEQTFLDTIEEALVLDRAGREERARLAELRERYESLTPRQREVMAHVVMGMLNKQIAAKLNTVEKTVKFHRANVMDKMQAGSVAELVHMVDELEGLRPRT
jgi:FixJ family two-component response regulator